MNLDALIQHLKELAETKLQLQRGQLPVCLVFNRFSPNERTQELHLEQIVFNGNSINIEVE